MLPTRCVAGRMVPKAPKSATRFRGVFVLTLNLTKKSETTANSRSDISYSWLMHFIAGKNIPEKHFAALASNSQIGNYKRVSQPPPG